MAFDGAGGLFPREFQLALKGQLQDYIDFADFAVMDAALFAVRNITERTKDRLRAMVTGAGLGTRLANAVRGEVYPNNGKSRNPAGWIYVRQGSVRIFEAFETGPTIRGKEGGWLTIPIPGSPADRKNIGPARPGVSPVERFTQRGIELSYVPGTPSRPAMLVARSVRLGMRQDGRSRVANARMTKSGAFAKDAASIPLFFLVPAAKLPKKLDWNREFERASAAFMTEFAAEMAEQLEIVDRRFRG